MASYRDEMDSPEPSTRLQSAPGPAAGGDDLDDLFDYDFDDPFADKDPFKADPPKSSKDTTNTRGAGLGIDEEVEVTKKPRAPRVKLDEDRLLSQAGIPRLRRRAKDLKFKGKGHEYSDAARLLQFYQLWLDDLFPKAKFLDALSMVEKLGHKRRMQMMRHAWIDEGRPRESVHDDSIFNEPALPPRDIELDQTATKIAPIFAKAIVERPKTPADDYDMDDDIYDASPRQQDQRTNTNGNSGPAGGQSSIFGPKKTDPIGDPEDDLDALLAEQEMEQDKAPATSIARHAPEPDFDDEMEAMAEMEGMW